MSLPKRWPLVVGIVLLTPVGGYLVYRWSRVEPAAGRSLAITSVTVIDVTARDDASAARTNQTVLIENGRITRVGPAATVAAPLGATMVDGRSKYLIPGLWDAHTHLTFAGEAGLGLWVANGITTARDLGYRLPELLDWKRRIRDGSLIGPRLLVSGPVLEGAWWLDAALREIARDTVLTKFHVLEKSPRYRLASPKDARVAVDSLIRLGVDLIKFRNLRGDEFRAVASEARRRGIPLVGHAPGDVSIEEAADSGIRSIEHAEGVTERLGDASDAERRAQFVRLARARTAITPTLVVNVGFRLTPDSVAAAIIADSLGRLDPRRRYVPRSIVEAWQFALDGKRLDRPVDWAASHRKQLADLRLAHQAGVPLLVGADAGDLLVFPAFSEHEELRLLVDQVGLTPLEALRGATIYPARSMGLADSIGVIAPGQKADLVLLDADPLRDVRNTTRIRAVILDGRLLARTALDSLLLAAERAASGPVRRVP